MTDAEAPAPKDKTLRTANKSYSKTSAVLRKSQNQTSDSSTVVNFVLDGPRQTVGFKCNKKLWKAFVSLSKREYGSVCHILEPIILALLTAKVNQGKTMKPVVIERLVVQRVVQRHRRVYHESVQTDIVQNVVQLGEPGVCRECGCRSRVYPRITVNSQRVFLCGRCAQSWIRKGFIDVRKG